MRSVPLFAVFLLASLQAFAQEVPQVVDGDTLKFGHQRVRLYGIDAPELRQTCDGGTWAAGRLARDALVELIGGQPVTCLVVVPRDRYGRPASTCSTGKMDLAYAMAERGWAWAFTRYSEKYVNEEKRAAAQHLGLHSHVCAAAWEWRAERRKGER
jgi:endonuclease YncB( thermonuclease family)